jgi:GAF domain-containing protein
MQACTVVQASHAVLLLASSPQNGHSSDLVIQAEYPPVEEQNQLALSSTILRRVVETGDPFHSPNVYQDERLLNQESILAVHLNAVAAVPLIGRSGVIGVLYVAALGEQKSLHDNKDNNLMLQALAGQAALSVEIAWSQENDGSEGAQQIPETHLLAHGLGTLLTSLRRRRALSLADVEERTHHIIDQSWLLQVESGQLGQLDEQDKLKLVVLADAYDLSPEILCAIAGTNISLETLITQSDLWLPGLLQDMFVLNFLHRLSKLNHPGKVRQVLRMATMAVEWVEESSKQ